MMKRFILLIATIAMLLGAPASYATPPAVRARLDSASVLMGKLATLRLEVTQDKGKPGGFPIFAGAKERGYVGVCGDTVEIRGSYKRDTLEVGSGRIQINYAVPVQVFDSGTYRLPPFVYVSGPDTARSNSVTLKVIPVKVKADDKISDYAPPADPEGGSILDSLPDWLYYYWWIILLVLLVAAATIWGVRRYREQGYILPRKPEPLPYDVAIKSLKGLKAMNLWEQGMEKEYFTRLTDILRVYLFKRFGINAIEMTTPEIVAKLNENDAIKDKRQYIKRILDTADFVKFAKVRPMPEDNIEAYKNALRFVEETKPSEEEIAAYKAALAEAESPKARKMADKRRRTRGKATGKLKKKMKGGKK